MKFRAIGWDKDSTLADSSQRHHMLADCRAGRRTWGEYAAACVNDKPVEAAVTLMRLLGEFCHNIVMSGAEDCPEARGWLSTHLALWEHGPLLYDDVRFRQPGDDIDNGLLKVRWIKEYQDKGYEFALYVEDWPVTAQLIREQTGIPVLVLNPCYPDELAALAEWRERIKGHAANV